ncbi:MAG: hypothetical protein MJ001_02200 [Paludibacteraceae bacterium]|nr:hypothetical protein [Paludibacteraceae bacterium]
MKNKCWKICVVTIIAIAIVIPLVWILCGVCNHTITLSPDGASCLTNCQTDTSVAVQSERVSELTLVVNGINNILTSTNNIMTLWALVVSILTLLVAVVGLFGYHELKKEINIYKEKIDDCQGTTKEIKDNHNQIMKTQSLSNLYMQEINKLMYKCLFDIAQLNDSLYTRISSLVSSTESEYKTENSDFNFVKNSTEIINLIFYQIRLLLTDEKTVIDDCIKYIKQRGNKDEIETLQLIVDNDTDKYKKERVSEAIGYIRGRLS